MLKGGPSSPFRHWVIALGALAFAALLLGIGQMLRLQIAVSDKTQLVTHLERLLSSAKDLETGTRGYVISGDRSFLQPYEDANRELATLTETFRTLAARDRITQAAIDSVLTPVREKQEFSRQNIVARDDSLERGAAKVASGEGRAIMDRLRQAVATLQATENSEIERAAAEIRQRWPYVIAIALGALLLAGLLLMSQLAQNRTVATRIRGLLNDVIESAPIGIALLDDSGRVLSANGGFARMLSRARSSVTGQYLTDLSRKLAEATAHERRVVVQDRTHPEPPAADEMIPVEADDGVRYVTARAFPITIYDIATGEDARHGAGLVLTDMTRQRAWEQQLQEARDSAEAANRAKSAFIANMSHELRTPLTAVVGYCELLEDEFVDHGKTELLEDLNKINVNAKHLLGLINDVLDLSKIEAQRMSVHAVSFTLGQVLTEVEAAVGAVVNKNGNALVIDCRNREIPLRTDDLKLKQILLNLIGNAAKFTHNGTITVRADAVPGTRRLRIAVCDTGIGMGPEQMANLFERFKQGDETTTRRFGGTGLGLALTRALAKTLGGDIEVKSVLHEGSTFSVTIPTTYTADSPAPLENPAPTPTRAEPQKSPTILVVDDDPSAQDLLQRHLVKEGFEVAIAADGHEALSRAKTMNPSAILLDVLMPGLDGWQVLTALRADPETADIPVVIQTVLDEERFAYAMGARAFLKKPIARHRLAQALADIKIVEAGSKILVVDDDTEARMRICEQLKRDGWTVIEAANGREALSLLRQQKPQLMLVDLIMPVMDGYELIRTVRAEAAYDDVPIVVLTAGDVHEARVRRLRDDTTDIVQKGSISIADLVADLRRHGAQAARGTQAARAQTPAARGAPAAAAPPPAEPMADRKPGVSTS